MNKLVISALALFIFSCDGKKDVSQEDLKSDTANFEASNSAQNQQVTFACDSMISKNNYQLTVLMENFSKAIPVDTVSNCNSLSTTDASKYQTPETINGLAEAGDFLYYSYIDNNQLVIMKSPKGSDSMQYDVHMSIPLQAAVNQADKN